MSKLSNSCPNIVSKVAQELSHSGIGSGKGGWCKRDGEGRRSLAHRIRLGIPAALVLAGSVLGGFPF